MSSILVLESYYGGSHKAFLDGWLGRSEHDFTLLSLPPNKWKWRMRHAAITFAQQVNERIAAGECWDVLFCSDMLNLAEFLGLVDESIRQLPKIVYFHENQLTYPVQVESERDYQYCMTNITTATAADAVWFNSAFHRDEFLGAIGAFLKRMPDYQPVEVIEQIRAKSSIHPPGIEPIETAGQRADGPVRILWAARWEHDKNPEDFFASVKILKDKGVEFRLNVIGEQFRDQPEVFDWAKAYFADHIDRWGYQPSRSEYEKALAESDIVVSTANHEFFGIGMLEAITAGCRPVLPDRLSYPAIIESLTDDGADYIFDGSVKSLARHLEALLRDFRWARPTLQSRIAQYSWPQCAAAMD
ncbi:MAG: tRNA-queuosine alpha-mannosyltransferase domain-containing protein, partial [Planctomycetota bacterium]